MFKHQNKLAIVGLTNFILLCNTSSLLANEMSSVFHISKNDNGNQVHYGIRLDRNCSPIGTNPVYVYWQKENGVKSELMELEQSAYGIFNQSVSGQKVDIILNIFQTRGIQKLISFQPVKLNNGNCQASAFTIINGKSMQLSSLQILLSNIIRNPFNGGTIGGTVVNLTLIGSATNEEISCTSDCRFGL